MDTMLQSVGDSSDNLRIDAIPRDYIEVAWSRCAPLIQKALDRSPPDYSLSDLLIELQEGRALLLCEFDGSIFNGCAVVQILQYPQYKVGHVLAITGAEGKSVMWPNARSFALLGEVLKSRGCKVVQGLAEEPIYRLWRRIGFEGRRFVRKEL